MLLTIAPSLAGSTTVGGPTWGRSLPVEADYIKWLFKIMHLWERGKFLNDTLKAKAPPPTSSTHNHPKLEIPQGHKSCYRQGTHISLLAIIIWICLKVYKGSARDPTPQKRDSKSHHVKFMSSEKCVPIIATLFANGWMDWEQICPQHSPESGVSHVWIGWNQSTGHWAEDCPVYGNWGGSSHPVLTLLCRSCS